MKRKDLKKNSMSPFCQMYSIGQSTIKGENGCQSLLGVKGLTHFHF